MATKTASASRSSASSPAASASRSTASSSTTRATRSGRPVMLLLELLGRRWTMRVLWELREGRLSFRALQQACDSVSPAVLNERLRELREAGLVDLAEGEGYGLSALGKELLDRFLPIVGWAERWAKAAAKTK